MRIGAERTKFEKALNSDQFSKIMVDENNVLNNHRFDNARESNISKKAYIRDLHQRNDNDKNNNDKKDDVSPILSFIQM